MGTPMGDFTKLRIESDRGQRTKIRGPSPLHTTLARTANLANLLPTGTVLGFQAMVPSFTNYGKCHTDVHKYLAGSLIAFFALMCVLSSFTDSFIGFDGRLYYGIATSKGLFIFNNTNVTDEVSDKEDTQSEDGHKEVVIKDLAKYRITFIDFVHAFVSLLVFLIFAVGDSIVVKCFFGELSEDENALFVNLPLAVGGFASFLFMLFPTTRRGIGYADTVAI